MADSITLYIDGRKYGGWKAAAVSRSMDSLAGAFSLSMTQAFLDERLSIKAGSACRLAIGPDTAVTGYVDALNRAYDARGRSVSVSGRDKTGDLVDCSAAVRQWSSQGLSSIITELAAPFSIPVRFETDAGGAFKNVAVNPGETVYEVIERLAALRGLMAMSDGAGGLVFCRAGTSGLAGSLEAGRNILSGQLRDNFSQRFSTYSVKGQHLSTAEINGQSASAAAGSASDAGVGRHRPLILSADDNAVAGDCRKRAEWEKNVRAGRSRAMEYQVVGFRADSGRLWAPNTLVNVRDPENEVSGTFLVTGVRFAADERGKRTALTVMDPGAYEMTV